MESKKIIIATESYVVNQGLHLIFNKLRHGQVVDKASNYDELIQLINRHEVDIILISSQLFKKEGTLNHFIHELGDKQPELIAYLTEPDEQLDNQNMFRAVIRYNDSKESVLEVLNGILAPKQDANNDSENFEVSDREKDILKQVALGLTNNEIGERLFISAHTVTTHRKRITKKLGIKSVSGLTVYAIINGLVEMEEINEKES